MLAIALISGTTIFQNGLEIVQLIFLIILAYFLIRKAKLENRKLDWEISFRKYCDQQFSTIVEEINNKIDSLWTLFSVKPQVSTSQSKSRHRNSKHCPSLFDYRLRHFSEEKQVIANTFVKHIYKHIIKPDTDNNDSIVLLMDSGSTIYYVFLALHTLFESLDLDAKNTLRKIRIVTNNLPGILYLTEHCRIGSSIDAEMVFPTYVLPGNAEGKYAAVLGNVTAPYIKKYLSQFSNPRVVGAITGNYISLKCGILIRGLYHDEVKEEIINQSTDLFVLSPLGKFLPFTYDDINNQFTTSDSDLYDDLPIDSSNKRYNKINVSRLDELNTNHAHIITTSRRNLTKYGEKLISLSNYLDSVHSLLDTKCSVTTARFNPLYDCEQVILDRKMHGEFEAVLKYEFPHREMRNWMRDSIEDRKLDFTRIINDSCSAECDSKEKCNARS